MRSNFYRIILVLFLFISVSLIFGIAPGAIRAQNVPVSLTLDLNPTMQSSTILPSTDGILVQYSFKSIQQGRAGLITIDGKNLVSAIASTFGRVYPCFPINSGYACLIAVPMTQTVKNYPISIDITTQGGTLVTRSNTFSVISGQFLVQTITLPSKLVYLVHNDVQANEEDRLLTAYSIITPIRYWEGAFTPPVNSAPISPFGAVRNYNNLTILRHTGQDFHAPIGTPVLASASGKVVLSRLMDIHGNNIVIDHGWGIYSEYAHLSERYVVPGQFVLQGQIIGMSGNTGRSTGPHIHWEIAVDDIWINPLDFIQLQLPPP